MLRTTLKNVAIQRTIKPVYGFTQATPQVFSLDPEWDKSVDIYPGMVATKLVGEVVTLSDGAAGTAPLGLFAQFIAPKLGIDEVTDTGVDAVGIWVGGKDAQFEVLAPAWDNELPANMWTESEGTPLDLVAGSGSVNRGRLCPKVALDYTGTGALAGHDIKKDAVVVARLIAVLDQDTILIQML